MVLELHVLSEIWPVSFVLMIMINNDLKNSNLDREENLIW